jgi:phthalate 4,5-dioxygenase oxygenase subunit
MPGDEIWCLQRDCNWLQALEGDIDTSHVGFLHVGNALQPDDLPADHPMRPAVLNRAPRYEVTPTALGHDVRRPPAARRRRHLVARAHFMFPFWTQTPNMACSSTRAIARAWVPMDDHALDAVRRSVVRQRRRQPRLHQHHGRNGEPLFEKFRYAAQHQRLVRPLALRGRRPRNDWGLIDREAQRSGRHYTGIEQHHACRTRRSPKAWARSPTTTSSTWRPAT